MQQQLDKHPLLVMIEAIAYFLSGSFLVQTIHPYLAPTLDPENPIKFRSIGSLLQLAHS